MLYSIELRSQWAAKIINLFVQANLLASCILNKIMKIYFWSVGKAHESYVKDGIEIFTKRISHYYPVEWKIFTSAKNASSLSEDQIKKIEATQLMDSIQPDDLLIALDENGKQWTSPELAVFIQSKANSSTKNLIFLIGGAYGLHETILSKCKYKWSLSKLVFPHQLVRLILSEQVYRACTIIRNEKYHHS
jgi:23S rRNA (pseudouridine1915-N3)-methyltransferase